MPFEPTPIELVAFPARRVSLTFTHPTAGDEIFCFMVEAAAKELFEADRTGTLGTFTASNGVTVEVCAHEHL